MSAGPRSHPPVGGGLPPTPESWLPNEHSLYRPRHSPRQRTALTCAVVFFLAPALAFVLGVRPQAFENRALAEFPSITDGWGFFTGLSAWATDHLPLREAGIDAASGISTGVFRDPPDMGGGARDTVGVSPGSERQETPPDLFPDVISGTDNWLYLGEDVKARCYPARDVNGVVTQLNKLREAVEASGREFELVIAPDKTTVMPQHLPESYLGKECAQQRAAEFWRRVPAEAGAIDLRPALRDTERQTGEPLYDAIDSHWNFAGGLTMTYALAERIAPGSTATWQVGPDGTQEWPADLPRMLGRQEQRQLTRYTLAPDGGEDRTRYLASDFRTMLEVEQRGDAVEGTIEDKVGVIADSYTQFATPFLTAAVRDLSVVHAETVAEASVDQIAELLADRDVVVVEFVERIVTGGASALLHDDAIHRLGAALAANPR
ncbi:alginate O-acetyltransferase AlgX-related protein [Prauserella endophytica]|uniref:alginate O-acetyltransferase AlgX-related protein n=1 Tax=Prauserella endophytica TaxID=1592324 RepID=UPI001E34BD2F|nr:hypothetical protein [Prauserella endophytica]